MDNIEKDINEIMEYIKDLKEENRKQKEILEIFKDNLYTLDEDILMNRIFACEKENKIIKEWLDNDK